MNSVVACVHEESILVEGAGILRGDYATMLMHICEKYVSKHWY